jgi:hypothetical protein
MRKRTRTMAIVSTALSAAFLSGFAITTRAVADGNVTNCQNDNTDRTAESADQHPFACDRSALDSEARKRHFNELGPALGSMRKTVRELADGYEFQFPSDAKSIAMVAEWAAGERLCCPFFKIELRIEPEHGPFWLRLTGREGTKQFIQADLASWNKQ